MFPDARIVEATERIRGVFLEVPGTQLSPADASRLAGLEKAMCIAVLKDLEDARFLSRTRKGLFVRRSSDSPIA
jgi:hypothetical protein